MYNQDEYIFNEFNNSFSKMKEVPIVLYGIGIATGKLLEKTGDYNIVGLMDGKRKNGTIWERPIIDEDDVVILGAKIIVIVARPAVIGMIYHRIENFAKINEIDVFDIHGIDLKTKYQSRECDLPFYHLEMEDMRRAVDSHNVVTFDVFDTLVIRKTLYPKDIFYIVERSMQNEEEKIVDFANERMKAEGELYNQGLNPKIYEIYNRIEKNTGKPKKLIDRYMEVELQKEIQFIEPRKSMLSFFNEIKNKKSIYLISDMYLTEEIMQQILKKCGYEGFEGLYISCEKNCSKSNGLFDVFLSDGHKKEECIHIGDNYVADGQCARAAGIDTFEIMSEREMLENSAYNCVLDRAEGLIDNLIIGMFCSRAFDNPFTFFNKKGKLELDSHKDIAFLCCAPVISYYCFWLMQCICTKKCDYVLYPSRDAYIIEKICKNIERYQACDAYPQGEYFYTSRRALFACSVFDRKDIQNVAKLEFHGNLRELFLDRFNVDIVEDCKVTDANIEQFISLYEKDILENCKKERNNYKRYLENIASKKRIAFIDFVAAGSIQNGLRKLLDNKDMEGFYFLKRNTDNYELEKCIKVESFYTPHGDFELDANVYKYYYFLELLLTSSEPTLYSMDENLSPVFMKEVRTKEHVRTVEEMQNEIISYCCDIAKVYPFLLDEKIVTNVPDAMIGFLGKEYSQITSEQVLSLVLTDEYLSMKFNIFDR